MTAPVIHGCTGKKAFDTFRQAARAGKSLNRHDDNAHVAPYHCTHCNRFHLGQPVDYWHRRSVKPLTTGDDHEEDVDVRGVSAGDRGHVRHAGSRRDRRAAKRERCRRRQQRAEQRRHAGQAAEVAQHAGGGHQWPAGLVPAQRLAIKLPQAWLERGARKTHGAQAPQRAGQPEGAAMRSADEITPASALAKGRERLLRDIQLTEEAVEAARQELAISEPELQRLKAQLAEFDAFVARTLPVAEARS